MASKHLVNQFPEMSEGYMDSTAAKSTAAFGQSEDLRDGLVDQRQKNNTPR